jgi:hypothetical protein
LVSMDDRMGRRGRAGCGEEGPREEGGSKGEPRENLRSLQWATSSRAKLQSVCESRRRDRLPEDAMTGSGS